MEQKIRLDSIEDAIADFRKGKFVIVVDDEDRENEGDLIVAAEKINPRAGQLHVEKCPWRALHSYDHQPLQRIGTITSS